MQKYQVEITETLQRVVEIKAGSPDDAVEEVMSRYKKEEIVLDSSDYIDTEILLYKDC
jgi:hypothetical protein